MKGNIVTYRGFIPSFEWKDRKVTKTSSRLDGIHVKFRTHRLPNKSLERIA
jgi:hypothetical protein